MSCMLRRMAKDVTTLPWWWLGWWRLRQIKNSGTNGLMEAGGSVGLRVFSAEGEGETG